MSKLQPVRGTHDILPIESRQRRFVVEAMQQVAERYGFGEIATPMFEFSEVFHRTLGDTSDVVTKETYTFTDRGGESITLRPEFTASVVRAFLSNGLQQNLPCKFFYHGPAFRYERPQKGRLRQFHQFGVELLGVADPMADVEVIAMAYQMLSVLELQQKVHLELNTLGDVESRDAYRDALVKYFTGHKERLSEDSKLRLEKNPLRILDSKDAGDRELIKSAPRFQEYLTPAAKDFYKQVRNGIDMLGIPAERIKLNEALVRGLDYYNHTVFEFVAEDGLGSQNTVLAGGRYDGLVKLMGGPDTPGIGWAAGIERLCALVDFESNVYYEKPPRPIAIISDEEGRGQAYQIAYQLREAGHAVEMAYTSDLSKGLKRANKINAAKTVIVRAEEKTSGFVLLKDMDSQTQTTLSPQELLKELS